jgi:hypothetical protein
LSCSGELCAALTKLLTPPVDEALSALCNWAQEANAKLKNVNERRITRKKVMLSKKTKKPKKQTKTRKVSLFLTIWRKTPLFGQNEFFPFFSRVIRL